MTTKKEFLAKHNALAPKNLQATIKLLNQFRTEKPGLFNADNQDDWPIEKVRRPFIFWLTSLTNTEKQQIDHK